MIDRALGNGIKVSAWTFDELHGRDSKFLDALDKRKQAYVAEIPSDTHIWTVKPDVVRETPTKTGKGQPKKQLFRPPKTEEIVKPCLTCQGLFYKGRTGIFELLEVTDPMRAILAQQPKGSLLRKAAKSARQRSLQEEGILMVAKGITSIPELMRVLKQ